MATEPISTGTTDQLPPGTSPEHARLHRNIRRVCYVLLFGLVFEGALTFPLLAIWYGVPSLSPTEVCDELHKVMYSDGRAECETPYPIGGPPFGGQGEGEGQQTSRDQWSINPKPQYPSVEFRELVERHEACESWRTQQQDRSVAPTPPPNDYCNYITP